MVGKGVCGTEGKGWFMAKVHSFFLFLAVYILDKVDIVTANSESLIQDLLEFAAILVFNVYMSS